MSEVMVLEELAAGEMSESEGTTGGNSTKCPFCSIKPFSSRKNLFKHLRNQHGEKGNMMAGKMMDKNEEFKCHFCGKQLKNRIQQRKHEKNMHEEADTLKSSRILCKEKNCNWTGQYRVQLRNHLETVHSFSFDIIPQMTFDTMAEFEKWFSQQFADSGLPFSFKDDQAKKLNGENEGRKRIVRECSRSGVYSEKEDRKRRKLERGTAKIGHRCTMQITYVREPNGSVTMEEACCTHYGHDVALKHTLLAKDDRMAIAVQAQMGIPVERIVRNLNQTIGIESDRILRKQMVTRKDVRNIAVSFGIQCDFQRHGNDAESVEIRVRELQTLGTCLYYKPQKMDDVQERHKLGFDDFVLIIQTKLQSKLLVEFGPKFVCLDSTHHASRYHFQLYTLMVADEEGSGQPVAHMITNREECEDIVELFCRKVRENLEMEIPFCFVMTDDKKCLYDGLVSGFQLQENPPRKLLCTWHLRRNVSTHAYKKIKDKLRAEYWYRRFVQCQESPKEEIFEQEWRDFFLLHIFVLILKL